MPVLDTAARSRYDAEWRPLIRRVAAGDLDAFGHLYDAASPVVYLLARLVLRDEHEAREAVVEAFEDVWRRAGEFDPRQSACAWVAKIANERAHARRRLAAGPVPGTIPGAAGGDLSSRTQARHLRAALASA